MSASNLYAAFLDLENRPVLLVGGGSVAARKARALLRADADVTVVCPGAGEDMAKLERAGSISRHRRSYRSSDIEGKWLVIAATDDEELNRAVSRDAEEAGIFCNVVDCPELCSFQVPATVRRGDLQLAISTRGSSPLLARRLRERLEEEFGPEYEPLLRGLSQLRDAVQEAYPGNADRRRTALQQFVDSDIPGLLLQHGDQEAFERGLREWMRENLK